MKLNIAIFTAFLLFTGSLIAQPLSPTETNIPVRDGQTLAADIYIPQPEISRPTILIQTPYNKLFYRYSLPLGFGTDIDNSPYNFVIVDWRGFYASASAANAEVNRGEDGYDIIDWIKDQTWSDGKIGTWGASALGKVQFQTAKEQHPNHICAVPLVASPQMLYQEYYPNGVYREEYIEQLDALGYGMSTLLEAHPYYDLTWQYTENITFYPESIDIPMLMICGWFDHDSEFKIQYFQDLLANSPSEIAEQHKLLIGPWAHGGFGQAQVGSEQQGELFFPEAEGYSDEYALAFFDYYLLNAYNGWLSNPTIKLFHMGDMEWRSSEAWPLPNTPETLYFQADGSLLNQIPELGDTCSSFLYYPQDPSPTIGGPTLRQDLLQGPYDQSIEVESRDDILIFDTPSLTESLSINGNIHVNLYVSSNRPDTDFAVRLCDVYPDGRSILLLDGIYRMRFRNGFEQTNESFMTAGEVYPIEIVLPSIAHSFLSNHKLRVDISSSNYPRFHRNINNGEALYSSGDTLTALNAVHHNADHSSSLLLPIKQSTSITNLKNKNIKIGNAFPNPASKQVFVPYQCPADMSVFIQITDISGRVVETKPLVKGHSLLELNLDTYTPGMYQIKFTFGSKLVQSIKFVKQ
ncbi:MAG: CocE/NonD family hydrolase [Bacteroidales bacterium]|jgi:predicted acyl esterase|nr:CocE/NonD family hydrolase [Bacteroidales bacterium]